MNKKKILAVVAAAAMTATMSLPVFAEDATPGEISQNNVEVVKDLLANKPVWDDSDKNSAKGAIATYVSNVTAENNVVTEDMATCVIEAYSKMPEAFEKAEEGTVFFYSEAGQSENITLNKLDISDEKDSVTIDVKADNKSELGYIVEIPMPDVEDNTEYAVVFCSDGTEFVQDRTNTNKDFSFKVKDGMLTIWVPHFTTYTLNQVSTTSTTTTNNSSSSETQTSAAAPAATAKQASGDTIQYYTCPACGYHNWTATSEGYRCDNCGRIESEKQLSGYGNVKGVYEPTAAAVAENPIKATGSDMSLMIFAVVALAGVAACGLGVVSKKSRKVE